MASNLEYVEYICDQISGAGSITYRKMFGDYGIYCDGKVIGVICDNQFFVKKTASGAVLIPDCEEAAPYTEAKPHLLIECVDNRALMAKFIATTLHALPEQTRKRKRDGEKQNR